jgi:S1-C subfamily serine protease
MRKVLLSGALFLSILPPVRAQAERATLKVRAILLDDDLNQKPVPRLLLQAARLDGAGGEPLTVRTDFDGTAELVLAPGRYRITTPDGVQFQARRYRWDQEIAVSGTSNLLELSNDNAAGPPAVAPEPPRRSNALIELFRKYQNSVVTVWTEFGHGTGFVVDEKAGLILTNQHVIGAADYVAVQFDEKRKVAAKIVAFDSEADIGVLWANLEAFPEVIAAPLAKTKGRDAIVAEGDPVFTIGSPLNQKKIMTSGIVSKVNSGVILSDVRINHGNSGGPLFTMDGTVIGLTSFVEADGGRTGISGIVRIERADLLLERARTKMRDMTMPDGRLLAVEPGGTFPLSALKQSLEEKRKFDVSPYIFRQDDFDVAIVTPILKYHLSQSSRVAAQEEKERRTTHATRAIKGTFQPLADMKDWEEYTGEYRPEILIEASPRLGADIRPKLDLKRLDPGNPHPVRLKFKSDFYRMKLFCGTKEIEAFQPDKAPFELNYHSSAVEINDASFIGFYTYPYDAISPECSSVTLQLYSEKEPDRPIIKLLDAKTIERVAADFKPYRETLGDTRKGVAAVK